jgi:hypothetical protein
MKSKISRDYILYLVIFIIIIYLIYKSKINFEYFDSNESNIELLNRNRTEGGHFPYRYLTDEKGIIVPIVLVSAFFRDDNERNRFTEYTNRGIKVVGITAYKSFPKIITDTTGDSLTKDDQFDYLKNIKVWFCCFRNPSQYGFNETHRIIDYSESDYYDYDQTPPVEKKYDFIYVCNNDDKEKCPMDGWNAINRNFKLALACFPIMINEFKLKILIIGRMNCGLEALYGDKIEILDFLPYHNFQQKMRESRFLFVPNIYDASPRVISEALIKDIPVLLNNSIVCGSKYINDETGEFFTDENDIRLSLSKLLVKKDRISPKKWWQENYSRQKSGKKFRDFLYLQYPDILEDVKEIYFG